MYLISIFLLKFLLFDMMNMIAEDGPKTTSAEKS